MKTPKTIPLAVYYPETEAGKHELATRVAKVHSDVVLRRLRDMPYSNKQKLDLLQAIAETADPSQKKAHTCHPR